ncbi:SIR2 family protein [Enterococcus gilvus]|uniref:SIR2 family protein n=1 Tax=Enterococcus gilvus TaxID=160453 RepID=UPI002910E74F|nr:SIR2 family protein [Enterococcus gilvus]MDU5509815.1 SIR2 family protein [Enterococcus gilvus]
MGYPLINNLKGIVSALSQEDCILFIGSGISLWSKIPSWKQLIQELADFVENQGENNELVLKELESGDLLQAASYGLDKLSSVQASTFFKQSCRIGISEPHSIHNKIINLGPTSFITTNYDTLLEDSIRKWCDKKNIDVVTNRQLTEMANIVQSNSKNFIYKFHGDVNDVASIILTREQYRVLLPQGERHNAMETLKTLLISRPVVYLGFGLRDPDFLYLKDILINTFKGNNRDHFAIMPNISIEEANYWKKNYGIQLVTYTSSETDHSNLINLLDEIKKLTNVKGRSSTSVLTNDDYILALTRYASKMEDIEKKDTEFIINISRGIPDSSNSKDTSFFLLKEKRVSDFLVNVSENTLLIGSAGAGKTFSLKKATSRIGRKMFKSILSEENDLSNLSFPIYLDLKMYNGSLEELVKASLPPVLLINELYEQFDLQIFIDSFNETPNKFREKPEFIEDIQAFLDKYSHASILIASRSLTGLEALSLPTYFLDEIDNKTIDQELEKRKVILAENWHKEIYLLLKKPLFFQYFISGKVLIEEIEEPKDFYEQIFYNVQKDFEKKFKSKIDLIEELSDLAYDVIDNGDEAFSQLKFFEHMQKYEAVFSPNDLINWLISKDILTPQTLNRISFVHQSITEYLGALKLAKQYTKDEHILRSKLGLYRWDQSLYFSISLLPQHYAKTFIEELFELDFTVAMKSLKYVEYNQTLLVEEALAEIANRLEQKKIDPYDLDYISAIKFDLPIDETHEDALRKIIFYGNLIGGSALAKLVSLKGETIKKDLYEFLILNLDDYNFCANNLAPFFCEFVTEDDVMKLNELTIQFENENMNPDDLNGFIPAISSLTKELPLDVFIKYFVPKNLKNISKIRLEIISEKLKNTQTTESLNMLGDLMIEGYYSVITDIYFVSPFKEREKLSWTRFSTKHVDILLNLAQTNNEEWILYTLEQICDAREDLKQYALNEAEEYPLNAKAPINFKIQKNSKIIFDYFKTIVGTKKGEQIYYNRIDELSIDWQNNEELFLKIIEHSDYSLISSLMGGSNPPTIIGLNTLPIKSIFTYLDQLNSLFKRDKNQWILNQLSYLLTKNVDDKIKKDLLNEFNNPYSPYMDLLLDKIMKNLDFTVDQFSKHTIQYIIKDLCKNDYSKGFMSRHLLISSSTEEFVEHRLIPLLTKTDGNTILDTNLRYIIRSVGKKFGKRYLLDS